MNLYAVELPQLRGRRRVDGVDLSCRFDDVASSTGIRLESGEERAGDGRTVRRTGTRRDVGGIAKSLWRAGARRSEARRGAIDARRLQDLKV